MDVRPIGGLCNRLRVIGSRLALARAAGKTLTVWWGASPDCPANYRDLFAEPPSDLIIYENRAGPPHVEVACRDDRSISVSAWAPVAIETFRPTPAIQARIDSLLARLGPSFVAVHIRRTDHNKRYDEDIIYAKYAQRFADHTVFAAADNPLSIVTLKKALGDRLHYAGAFSKTGIRLTAVADAVVDLWVAAAAQQFRGTYYSSFSDWIEMMRQVRGLPAGDLSKIERTD